MANSCNMKLLKDVLIAKPHEMSFQLMSPSVRDPKGQENEKGYERREEREINSY